MLAKTASAPADPTTDTEHPARSESQAWGDAVPDPQVLLKAVRDSGGRVVDFTIADINRATCEDMRGNRQELLGRSISGALPNFGSSGLLSRYVQCLETREPLVADGFLDLHLGERRRLDIRGNCAGADLLAVTWRDVTDRFALEQRLAESEAHYRLLAAHSSDVIVLVRGHRIRWISPSVEQTLGSPPSHWVGREPHTLVAIQDVPILTEALDAFVDGRPARHRLRARDADGGLRWVDFHAKPFSDADGSGDGVIASFRVIDEQVAAERHAEAERRRRATADAQYRKVMDNSIVPTSQVTPKGRFVMVNQAMCDFLGYDEDTLLQMTWQEVTDVAEVGTSKAVVAELIAGRADSGRFTKHYVRSDGHRILGDVSVGCIRKPGGDVENLVAQIIDITAQEESRRRLAEREDNVRGMESLLRAVQELSMARSLSAIERIVSAAARELTGCDSTTFARREDNDHLRMNSRVESMVVVPIRKLDPIGAIGHDWATPHQASDHEISLLQTLADSAAIAMENIQVHSELERRVHDRTAELEQANERIRRLSVTDELTGLNNRRGFYLLAEPAIDAAGRHGHDWMLAYLDIDRLKRVNDQHGHQVGDALITDVAQVLRATLRESDILARIGGDEFCVLADTDDGPAALRMRLVEAFANFNQTARRPYRLSVSIGLVQVPATGSATVDELIARSDRLMYREKRDRGR